MYLSELDFSQHLQFTITVYGVVSYKASHTLRPLMVYCVFTSEFYSFLIYLPKLSGSNHQKRHLVTKEKNLEKSVNFAYKCLFHAAGTCRKMLRHGTASFTSPPKEVELRIVIALRNPSSSPGFEPANLGPMASTSLHLKSQNEGVHKEAVVKFNAFLASTRYHSDLSASCYGRFTPCPVDRRLCSGEHTIDRPAHRPLFQRLSCLDYNSVSN
jgi:hypothetical protein